MVQQNNYNSNFGLSLIASEIASFRNSWENKRKRDENVAKAQAQLAIVKSNYSSTKNYPEKIIDGWHSVMTTDNYNYCSPAKVFVENNEIKKFVVGNWIELSKSFKTLSSIKDGKALLTIEFKENTDTVELYFMNDLEKPTIVEKPLESGFISFWSDLKKADRIKIWFEGLGYLGELEERIESQPECSQKGTVTIPVKPGIYKFKAAGRGSIAWEGNIEIKENSCLSYLLNKSNKLN